MYIYLAFLAFLFLIAVILVNVSWRLRRRVGSDVCKETISTEPNLGDHTYTSPFSVNNILTLHSLTPLDGGFPIILMNIDFIHSSLSSILLRPLLLLLLCTGTVFGQYHIYWGDVHGHSSLSDGKGSPDDYFTHARDVARLDFAILTDHDFGNGRPQWRMPKENWTLVQDKADEFNATGRFVAIGGYEWTSQAKYWSGFTNGPTERLFPGPPKFYNHKNVYFTNRIGYLFSAKDVAYNNPDTLAEAVRRQGGLIQNNHPFALFNEAGDQWEYVPANSSVIVNTEMGLDVSRHKGRTYELNWEKSLREFLNRGGRTGFVAGSDSHEGRPAARTAVLATELTCEAVFDALRHRRNYAINHARISLDFRINGHFMGEEIESAGKPQIMVDVKGTAPVEEIVIVRDGNVLHALRSQKQNVSFAYVDETFAGPSYYYLRVIQTDTDPHGNRSHAWSSPIWVSRSQSGIQNLH
ncbi:MAG: hypothetical protein A2283_13450 [Lentisphaerae bacterium RIFOXYA12_FULL_48_11]|nr:MAG: hypothetical protein A2283_13450 [Lentisphaerae bacterium RIFOXYA12_FULL_48_11]